MERMKLGAQGDPAVDVAVALGEEVEDAGQSIAPVGEVIARSRFARWRGQLLPGFERQAAIFGEASLAEHVGIEPYNGGRRPVLVLHLAGEEITSKTDGFGLRRTRRRKVDVSRAIQQRAATAVGIVDGPDGPLDLVHRPVRQCKHEAGAFPRRQAGEHVERRTYVGCPAPRVPIIDKVPYPCRIIYRLAQLRLEHFVVGVLDGCGNAELMEQSRIALGQFDDDLSKSVDALRSQMVTNARERVSALGLGVTARGIRRQRCRDHVLAEPPVAESGAGAFSTDLRAAPRDLGAVIVSTLDPSEDAPAVNGEDLDRSVTIVVPAAGEHLVARELAQCFEIEARWSLTIMSGLQQRSPSVPKPLQIPVSHEISRAAAICQAECISSDRAGCGQARTRARSTGLDRSAARRRGARHKAG